MFHRDDWVWNPCTAEYNNGLLDALAAEVEISLQKVELQTSPASVIVIEKIDITIGSPIRRALKDIADSA